MSSRRRHILCYPQLHAALQNSSNVLHGRAPPSTSSPVSQSPRFFKTGSKTTTRPSHPHLYLRSARYFGVGVFRAQAQEGEERSGKRQRGGENSAGFERRHRPPGEQPELGLLCLQEGNPLRPTAALPPLLHGAPCAFVSKRSRAGRKDNCERKHRELGCAGRG